MTKHNASVAVFSGTYYDLESGSKYKDIAMVKYQSRDGIYHGLLDKFRTSLELGDEDWSIQGIRFFPQKNLGVDKAKMYELISEFLSDYVRTPATYQEPAADRP